MKIQRMILPAAALGAAAAMLVPVEQSEAYSTLGFTLTQNQRDFRVWNNFTGTQANNNQVPDPNFPGYQGAVMAIWKGAIEWQSGLHGVGSGDPHQPFGLGSGGANFDPSFQGEALHAGGLDDNVHSEISGCQGGVLAYTESPNALGWRIRYLSCWTWEDGPDTSIYGLDLQGVACHEHGHALGMGHTSVGGQTMYPSISGSGVSARSIEFDDIAGVKFLYGVASSSTKPRIEATCIAGTQLTITGANFSPTGNQVWFTQLGAGGTGNPIKVTALPSDGSTIVCTIPANAGPGDVLVRNDGAAHGNLSNAWPSNLQDTGGNCGGGGTCPVPVNFCVAAPNSTGSGMIIASQGSACVSANDFVLWALGGPPNVPGIFFYGPGQTQVAFGDGFRCVSGTSYRLPLVSTDSFGDASFGVDLTVSPFSGGNGAWLPGSTWRCQFWYRDRAAGGAGFNLTNGLEVTLGH